jgi:hypothetical protein
MLERASEMPREADDDLMGKMAGSGFEKMVAGSWKPAGPAVVKPQPPAPQPIPKVTAPEPVVGGGVGIGSLAGSPQIAAVEPPIRQQQEAAAGSGGSKGLAVALVIGVAALAGIGWAVMGSRDAGRPSAGASDRSLEAEREKLRAEQQAWERRQREADEERIHLARQRAEQEAAAAASKAAQEEAVRTRRASQAKQLVSDYLSACDRNDTSALRRIFSADARYLQTTGAEAAIAEISSYAQQKPQRSSRLSQSDMELSWNGDRATVSAWMDFEHGDGEMTVKGRVEDEYVIEWDTSDTPRLASVRRLDSRPSSVSFDPEKQKKAVEQCLWGYYNAGDWSGGNPAIPDQGRFLADTVFYFDKRMKRDEIRADCVEYRRGLRSIVFFNENATLRGLGGETIEIDMTGTARKVDLHGQETKFEVKNHLVIGFRAANGRKPRIEEIRRMK